MSPRDQPASLCLPSGEMINVHQRAWLFFCGFWRLSTAGLPAFRTSTSVTELAPQPWGSFVFFWFIYLFFKLNLLLPFRHPGLLCSSLWTEFPVLSLLHRRGPTHPTPSVSVNSFPLKKQGFAPEESHHGSCYLFVTL